MSEKLPSRDFEAVPLSVAHAPRSSGADYIAVPVEDEGIHLRQVLGGLRRHLWLVMGTALLGLGVTGYLVYMETPLFKAGAVLRLVDTRGAMAGPLGDLGMDQLGVRTDPIRSQLLVLQSQELIGQVVDREGLRLGSSTAEFPVSALADVALRYAPDAVDTLRLHFNGEGLRVVQRGSETRAPYGGVVSLEQISFSVPAQPPVPSAVLVVVSRDEAIDEIGDNLTARPLEGTDGVAVHFVSADPQRARDVVNALVHAFQQENAGAAQQQAHRRRVFLEQQLQTTESLLTDAQLALSQFRSEHQALSSREQFAAQQSAMLQLDMNREALQSDLRMYQSLVAELRQERQVSRTGALEALVSMPSISSNAVVAHLYQQLVRYEHARDSLTTGEWRRIDTHPDVLRLNTLISQTEERLLQAVQSHLTSVRSRLAALDELRASRAVELRSLPHVEAEEFRLMQQLETVSKLGDQLRAEFQKARVAEAVESGQVEIVQLASRVEPVNSYRALKLMLGLMIGLILGGAGAILLEQLNTSVRRHEDIEGPLPIPGLAVIPQIQPGKPRNQTLRLGPVAISGAIPRHGKRDGAPANGSSYTDDEAALVALLQTRSTGAEAYRTLRTNLLFSRTIHALRTLVVTSPSKSEGKTTTAANLAVTFAQQGKRVLLVDCDLRRPRLDRIFRVAREPGLSNLLLDPDLPVEPIRSTVVENLAVLPAGALPSNPAELLGGQRMLRLLEVFNEHYDLVIFDSPPVLAASDATILGSRVDGVLLVVRAGRTDRTAVHHALQQLDGVGAQVIGSVLNDPDAKVSGYGGYYAYYDEYYGEDPVERRSASVVG